jgi:hypothetical protein
MSDALAYLLTLITDGIEFPDAVWKTTQKFRVSAEALTEEYDNT